MASASSTTPSHKFTYDVFLSFDRESTVVKDFVDHLSDHLRKKSIHTFQGLNQLRIGESIAAGVLQRIRESRVAIVIFSNIYTYLSSKFLDEFAEIMQCKKELGQIVVPVFIRMWRSSVFRQRGQKEMVCHYSKPGVEKIERWERALKEAANIPGHIQQFEVPVLSELLKDLNSDTAEIVMGWIERVKAANIQEDGPGLNLPSELVKDLQHDREKIEMWRTAMEKAANIQEDVLDAYYNGNTLACIKGVVDDVLNNIQLLPTFQNMAASTFSVTDSQSTREWTYDVFLSFNSEDKSFVDHLHYNLKEKEMLTFKELEDGEKQNVEQAIQESRAAIVIFSLEYVSSERCLDEVAAIMKCKQELGQLVVPIFYDVEQSDVHRQRGIVYQLFEDFQEMFEDDRISRWREALTEVASIKGRDLNADYNGCESTCINSVVDDIYKQLFPARGSFLGSIKNWQKGQILGSGSFGKVYECITHDGGFFAVKEVSLHDPVEKGQERIYQLQQEISLLSQFEHENIVRYLGTDKDKDNLYIFLELVPNGSLVSLYRNCKYQLDDKQVSAYTRQIVRGLHYLHSRGVVHRDIKCANILVHVDGSVKLADFGLAKVTKLNDINSCKGTAFWMAPEVVKGNSYGCSADIWSLGCTVLEMLTGKFPYSELEPVFKAKTNGGYGSSADIWSLGCTVLEMLTGKFPYPVLEPMAVLYRIGNGELPHIPEDLSEYAKDFIHKCLQLNPSDRPSAVDLLHHPFLRTPSTLLSTS